MGGWGSEVVLKAGFGMALASAAPTSTVAAKSIYSDAGQLPSCRTFCCYIAFVSFITSRTAYDLCWQG